MARNEVEGEKGQGAKDGIATDNSEQGEQKVGMRTTSPEGPNPFPKLKKAWSQLSDETKVRLQKYVDSPVVVPDAGMVRNFRLAMDEMYVRDPQTGKGRGVRVVPATDLAGLLVQMEKVQAGTGLVPELVMYEEGMVRNEFTRRVVTRELMLESESQANADQAAQVAGLMFRDAPAYAPGKFIYLAESSPEALAAWTQLEEQKIISSSLLLARQQAKRAMPNDPLINNQWHLKFNNQAGAISGTDVNIDSTWAYPTSGAGRRGRGIYIGVVDDGLETGHPDLSANVDTAIDKDWNGNDSDPNPSTGDDHGTACAGNVAAVGNNGVGVSGTAPEAKLVGMRLISTTVADSAEAEAMTYRSTGATPILEILSNSWGPADDGATLEAPGPLTAAALKTATETGRGGKGTIIMWAGGNGLDANDNSNYDGYANSIYTIAVGAFDSQSRQAWYSEPGANLVVTAPSSGDTPALGITTVDRSGSVGYNSGTTTGEISGQPNYTQTFGGTSSATPTASGIVALMLEANPNLGWRDVQEILMRSAKKVNPSDTDWKTPVAPDNIHHNHKFGAGLIDATAAVNLASTWVNLSGQLKRTVPQTGLNVAIPNQNTTGITREFVVTALDNIRVEHVTVLVNINHTERGNLKITLTSPSGTVSRLSEVHADTASNYANWTFMTVRNWGENAAGTWRLKITDESNTGNSTGGTLTLATLEIYGSATTPINPPPSVALTSPVDGSIFSPGVTVNLSATASDFDAGGAPGMVQSVEFLANGTVISSNNAAPYTFAWQPAVGSYSVTARATDSEGASANSAPISIQVVNRRPSVTGGQIIPGGELFSDQALTLSGIQSADPDDDPVTFAYQWQSALNDTNFADAGGQTGETLVADPSRSGKKWRCRITPSDAGGAGEPFFTVAVAVNRRPPTSATVGQAFSYDSDLFLAGTETNFTRKAILSEFSQGPSGGTAEWVEFLVLKPGTLRGWKLQDAAGGTVTLADVPAWDGVPAGTIVVIYNGASKDPLLPADDFSPGPDGKMVVSSTDTTMCSGSWPSLSNNGDGVILRDSANAILSQVGFGTGTITPNIGAVSGGKAANYRGNSEDGGLLAANWSVETATSARSLKTSRAPGDLFISEYLEGSSNNKAIELYNPSTASANLSTSGYVLEIYANGSTTASSIPLVGTVAAGATFVVKHSSASSGITAQQTSANLNFNGDDAVALKKGTSITDVIGQIGFDPGTQWSANGVSTLDRTLRRKASITQGDTNGANVFDPSVEWDGFAIDTFTGLGSHTIDGGGGGGGTLSLVITPATFSETAGTNAATGTLTLAQSQTTNLVVNLVSSDTTEATVPAFVTISANQTNATFAVAAVDDLVSDGSAGVTITATAGSLSATAAISVTDNEPSLDGVTPGAPNGGDNSVWVGQLRSGALNQPALFRLGSNNPVWLSVDPTNGVLSGTPSSSGNFTITLERTNSLGEISIQTFLLTVQNAFSTTNFSDWISGYPGLTGANAALDADPDGDGRSNLMEYYLGLNPAQTGSDSGSMTMSNGISNTFSMTFRRAKGVTGVTAAVEASGDLSSAWGTNGVQEMVTDMGTHEEVTATVTNQPGETRKFMRLRVSQP